VFIMQAGYSAQDIHGLYIMVNSGNLRLSATLAVFYVAIELDMYLDGRCWFCGYGSMFMRLSGYSRLAGTNFYEDSGYSLNSFTPRQQPTTSSAHIFSKSKVRMGKYLKKSCSYWPSGQFFFKYFPKCFVSFSRRHWQNSKMAMLGLNELKAGGFSQEGADTKTMIMAEKWRVLWWQD
jgi:hypothetical protein